MTTELIVRKTLGWLFLVLGIIIIAYIGLTTMDYFTGVYQFPEIFTSSVEVSSVLESSDSMNSMVQSMLADQMSSFISKDSITLLLNMSAWSLFAFFMVYLGGKVFELGLKAIKD